MLSGASSSAPKWSVIGDTGKATACSRGTISRPPPDAIAETTASTRKPRQIDGRIADAAGRRRRRRAAPRYAGTTAAATVSSSTTRPATRIRRRRLRVEGGQRNASSDRGPRGRRGCVGEPSRSGTSVEESAVDIAPPPRRRARRRPARRPRTPPRSTSAVAAGLRSPGRAGGSRPARAAPRARASPMTSRVASTPSGSTPSNGSSSSSTAGSWKAASTTESRRPMPWLNPLVTRCAASPSSKRSSRSRARCLPVRRAGAAGRVELQVLPRGRARHQARRRRGSSRPAASRPAGRVRTSSPATRTDALGRRDDPGQHPHRGGLAGAVAAEQGGARAGARPTGRCRGRRRRSRSGRGGRGRRRRPGGVLRAAPRPVRDGGRQRSQRCTEPSSPPTRGS